MKNTIVWWCPVFNNKEEAMRYFTTVIGNPEIIQNR